jgi:hypothetical protein
VGLIQFQSEIAPFDIPLKFDLVIGFTFKRLLFAPALHGICYTLRPEALDASSLRLGPQYRYYPETPLFSLHLSEVLLRSLFAMR